VGRRGGITNQIGLGLLALFQKKAGNMADGTSTLEEGHRVTNMPTSGTPEARDAPSQSFNEPITGCSMEHPGARKGGGQSGAALMGSRELSRAASSRGLSRAV
jgi:hypothetical protein